MVTKQLYKFRPAQVLIACALLLLGVAARSQVALATPDPTVQAALPGCHAVADRDGTTSSLDAGFCSGVIDTLLYLGELLPEDYRYCVPLDLSRQEIIHVMVSEMESSRRIDR